MRAVDCWKLAHGHDMKLTAAGRNPAGTKRPQAAVDGLIVGPWRGFRGFQNRAVRWSYCPYVWQAQRTWIPYKDCTRGHDIIPCIETYVHPEYGPLPSCGAHTVRSPTKAPQQGKPQASEADEPTTSNHQGFALKLLPQPSIISVSSCCRA